MFMICFVMKLMSSSFGEALEMEVHTTGIVLPQIEPQLPLAHALNVSTRYKRRAPWAKW